MKASVDCTAGAMENPEGLRGSVGSTMESDDKEGIVDWRGAGLGRFAWCLAFLTSRSPPLAALRPLW